MRIGEKVQEVLWKVIMKIIKTKSFEIAIFTRGDEKASRLAILIPGRLDTKDYINFVSHAEYLAGKGFFVVAFDPPGTWESPGAIDLYTTTNYIKATNELIEYFGNRPTLLLGHSRGATVSILTNQNPSVIGIILIMANFGDPTPLGTEELERGYKVSYRDMPPGNCSTKEQKEFKLPIAYWEDGKKHDVIKSLRNCAKPKLIIYGLNDKFISPAEVKELYDETPEPKMIKEENCSHDYRHYPEIIKDVEEEIDRFLKKYLWKI